MAKRRHSKGYWTSKRILGASNKCDSPSEFWRRYRSAASAAKRRNLYDQCLTHMTIVKKVPRGHHDKIANIRAAYKEAKNRSDLAKNFQGAMAAAKRLNLHNKLISKLPIRVRQPKVGSVENIYRRASMYKNVSEFIAKEPGAYNSASKLGILKDVTKHMKRKGNLYFRFVYQVFNGRHCYFGLTSNIEKRFANHRKSRDKRRAHLFRSPLSTKKVSKRMEAAAAREHESRLISRYQKNKAWIVLNKNDGGGLGSPCRIESVAELIEKARGKTTTYLKKFHPGSYKSICRLPAAQKKDVKAVMIRLINQPIADSKIPDICKGKTMAYLRKHYPGISKRLYRLTNKAAILATMV